MTHTSRTLLFRLAVLVAALAVAASVSRGGVQPAQPPRPPSQLPPELTRLLRQIKQVDTGMLAVSEEDGHFLRVMAAASRAKRALEIGSASGYSAIWIGLGLRETGGRL